MQADSRTDASNIEQHSGMRRKAHPTPILKFFFLIMNR